MEGHSGAVRKSRRSYSIEYVNLAYINSIKFYCSCPVPFDANTEEFLARTQPTSFFIVPFSRDPLFLGREDIIDLVDTKFKSERRVALTGIGGVG